MHEGESGTPACMQNLGEDVELAAHDDHRRVVLVMAAVIGRREDG
jgi:hypothetical protein